MPPDPQAVLRRLMLGFAAAMALVLAGHTAVFAPEILGWEGPARALKLGMAFASLLLGAGYLALLVRDVRGRRAPSSGLFTPVLLVVGLSLMSAAYRHGVKAFFWVGAGAVVAGAWGLGRLLPKLRGVS